MSPATFEFWALLVAVLWKICVGIVFPCVLLLGIGGFVVWLLKESGLIDL